MASGKVLIVGGHAGDMNPLDSAELFDPSDGSFTATGSLHDQRGNHTATTLADGHVLIAGGADLDMVYDSGELYQP